MKNLKKQFKDLDKIKIFEIEVIDKRTGEKNYIIFNISIQKNNLVAQHESLSKTEDESNKITFEEIELNNCFSLGENLSELYTSCIEAITESEFFELSE